MPHRSCFVAVLGRVGLATALLGPAVPDLALAADGAIELNQAGASFPIVLSESGRYVLTSNLSVRAFGTSAIRVEAEDVTLDLNGFTVSLDFPQSGPIADGVDAQLATGLTIRNGTIRSFNGNCLRTGARARIEDLTTRDCSRVGVFTSDGLVRSVQAEGNGTLGVLAGGTSVVVSSRAVSNGGDGIGIDGLVVDSVAALNGGDGIELLSESSTIRGNTVTRNTGAGIRAPNAFLCSATADRSGYGGNTITRNGTDVISSNCLVEIGPNVCGNDSACP